MKITKQLLMRIIILVPFIMLNNSCSKTFVSSIPDISFQLTISQSEIIATGLDIPGNSVFYPSTKGGFGGVWVVCGTLGYLAFDASCPYESNSHIIVENNGSFCKCASCKTLYNWQIDGSTFSGSNIGGPGTEPLRSYNVEKNQFGLIVFN